MQTAITDAARAQLTQQAAYAERSHLRTIRRFANPPIIGPVTAALLQQHGIERVVQPSTGSEWISQRGKRIGPVISTNPTKNYLDLLGICDKVEGFAGLPPDWDSYGAFPIERRAITAAQLLLTSPDFGALLDVPERTINAFPLCSGGVQLDIDGGGVPPIEVEIAPDGAAAFTCFGPNDEVLWAEKTLLSAIRQQLAHNDAAVQFSHTRATSLNRQLSSSRWGGSA